MRTFVIGDIHGCYDELIEMLQNVGATAKDQLIALGDIVDRGNKSKEVFEFFYNRPNSLVIMGNHERKHQKQLLNYAQEIVKIQFGSVYPKFLDWIKGLKYYHETEGVIIIHAFFEHDKTLAGQKPEVLCGASSGQRYLDNKYNNEKFWYDVYQGSKPIIYGHHVVGDFPKVTNNTFGIDTGACHGHYLTAIELPGFKIHRIKSKKDYWKEEQHKWQLPVLKAKNWDNMTFEEIEKQLLRFDHIQDADVVDFLNKLRNLVLDYNNDLDFFKLKIDHFTNELLVKHSNNFGAVVSSFSC